MDLRHRHLLGSKDHLQLRLQVKAYPPFFGYYHFSRKDLLIYLFNFPM